MNTTPETKTFRGRSLEEVLPQVRDELGPDAIVLRRREGLAGGVAGFFQRSYVEVEARGALEADDDVETRNDRATAEGLATHGIQTLVEQASPFADALKTADRAHEVLAETAAQERGQTPFLQSAGLYGPQPSYEPAPLPPVAAAAAAAVLAPEPAPVAPARVVAEPARELEPPAAATGLETKLVAAGLSAALA